MNIIKQLKDVNGNNIYPIAYAQGGVKMDLLWTNPNPTASFAAQTVSLDLSKYDLIMVITKVNTTTNAYYSNLVVKNLRVPNGIAYDMNYARQFIASDTGIEFEGGKKTNPYGTITTENIQAIPYQIYGIKMSYVVPTSVHGLQYVEVE